MRISTASLVAGLLAGAITISAAPQTPAAPSPQRAPAVEKLPDGTFRLGSIHVDTAKREISVDGVVNGNVTTLEFVACTDGGLKAYESALTLHTTGVAFNTALLLIGLDPSHAKAPRMHFDPHPPEGDPVEIWVQWDDPAKRGMPADTKRMRIEQLLFDRRTNQTLPEGPWVYTGSSFVPDNHPDVPPHYAADLDGVLIGFVHSPSPVIENPRPGAVNAYGAVILNPKAGLAAGTPVVVTVKAVDRSPRETR
jgi:hypothetical protein